MFKANPLATIATTVTRTPITANTTADRMATRGASPKPPWTIRSIAFWMMSRLSSRSGKTLMPHRSRTWSRCRQDVHHEHMVDATLSAQTAGIVCDTPHADPSSASRLGGVAQFDGLGSSRVAMRGIDDLDHGDVQSVPFRRAPDFGLWADQDRPDDTGLGAVKGAAQGGLVTWVNHDGRDRIDRTGWPRSACFNLVMRSSKIIGRGGLTQLSICPG